MVGLRLTVLATLVAATAVALAPASQAATKPLFPVTVQGANGPVTIAARPSRIVSLSPTATEDLFAIGAGPQVIAVDDQSNYPSSAPKTSLSGFRPNAEAIATYKPDLVVVASDGGIVASLTKLGIPVLHAPPAANLGKAYEEIRQLGAATGRPGKAATLIKKIQLDLTKVIRSVPKAKRKLSVFHEISPDGYSAASTTFIGSVYKLFGFRNVADSADTTRSGYPQVSSEFVISANPQLVVLSDSKCCGQTPATVAARPGWSNVDAVRNRRVIAVDDDVASRWGPRIVDFAKTVAAAARK
jgi:iron complex transport system substrate-binding protein